ncbi:MAG: DUF433 domain-containing protein [Bacilli bacterium]
MADRIAQTPGVLGGRPRIAGSRVSVAQVLDWVRKNGAGEAAQQLRDCQPTISDEDAHAAVEAALAFAAAVLDRILPDELTRQRPDWADQIAGWDTVSDVHSPT